MEKRMANILDKLIEFLSPSWAFKRRQYRDALQAEPAESRRARDDGGWQRLDDRNNPLNQWQQQDLWPRRPWHW
jgi:hypothetical protein